MIFGLLQLIIAIAIVALILLQERSGGMSGIFGGGESECYQTRRGSARTVRIATIVLAAIFAALSILNLII